MAKFQEINFQFDLNINTTFRNLKEQNQFNLILSTIYILCIKRVSLAEELVAKGSQLPWRQLPSQALGEKGQHSER